MTYAVGKIVSQAFVDEDVAARYWAKERERLLGLGFRTVEVEPDVEGALTMRRFRLEKA